VDRDFFAVNIPVCKRSAVQVISINGLREVFQGALKNCVWKGGAVWPTDRNIW
jgi:hypothetical protein